MKNYNKYILWGIIIVLLIPIIVLSAERNEDEEGNLLLEIHNGLGADFSEENIDLGGTILDSFIEEDELREIGEELKELLEIDEYVEEDFIEDRGFMQLFIYGSYDSNNPVTIILSSYKNMQNNQGETSIFINLQKKGQFIEFNDIIEKIRYFYDGYNMPVDITKCIIGTYEGDICLNEIEKLILEAIKPIKGNLVEEYKEEDTLSISIFTPDIEEYIYTGNRKMNLNIAARYNEYEDKTYIWIGTPIITIGY